MSGSAVRLAGAAAALVLALGGAGCATAGLMGKAAPDFTLPALGGGEVRLQATRGQVTVIDFWASWCAPCKDELPELEKLRLEYEPRGVRFIAVNIDDEQAAAAESAKALQLAMPVALDRGKKVAEAYGPPTMPTSYVLDREGVIRFVHQGYAGPPDVTRFRQELEALLH